MEQQRVLKQTTAPLSAALQTRQPRKPSNTAQKAHRAENERHNLILCLLSNNLNSHQRAFISSDQLPQIYSRTCISWRSFLRRKRFPILGLCSDCAPCPFLLTSPELHWCVARGFWQHFVGQSGYAWHVAVTSKLKNIQHPVIVAAPHLHLGLVCLVLMVRFIV